MSSCEFLVSAPGTGKTSYCIEEFRNEILKSKSGIASRSFFILPNREHADRIQHLVVNAPGIEGLFNAHILTINEFAARILGSGAPAHPTELIRRRILEEILCKNGEDSVRSSYEVPLFSYFNEARDFDGFYRLLTDLIREFKTSLLTLGEFEKLAQPLLKNKAFRVKFRDFTVLFRRYESRLNELGFAEPEDNIRALLGRPQKQKEAIDLVIFDGFYHFTRAQQLLVRALRPWARRVLVTLTISAKANQRELLFLYPQTTLKFLESAGFHPLKQELTKPHRTSLGPLCHLEANIFSPKGSPMSTRPDVVQIIAAADMRAEVRGIATLIRKFMREAHGGPAFSDICLILRQIGPYEKMIGSVFGDYGIPVRIHERKKLIEHGFVKTLHSFFNLILEDWRRPDLLAFAKSSYMEGRLLLEDALALESLALGRNLLNGRQHWESLLSDPGVGQGAKDVLKFVFGWERQFLAQGTLRSIGAVLSEFLNGFHYLPKDEVGSSGEESEESQIRRVIERVLGHAGLFYRRQPDTVFAPEAFLRQLQYLLETGLYSPKVRGTNRVQVYDAVMALPKEYKIVFVAGLLEKVFPKEAHEDPLFKDAERRVLNQKGVVLEERSWRMAGERYFFYMALARARERVILTYPKKDAEDRPTLPSFFLEEVKHCFPALLAEESPVVDASPGAWETPEEVSEGLAEALFKQTTSPEFSASSDFLELLGEWSLRADFREILWQNASGAGARISDKRLRALFSKRRIFSASRLLDYAICPFKDFCKRGLRLIEPLEGRETIETGNILHRVLEEFYREIPPERRLDPALWVDRAALRDRLLKKLNECWEKGPFSHERLYRQKIYFETIAEILGRFVGREAAFHAERGFVPSHFELEFGGPHRQRGALDYLKIPSPGGEILIEGKIDRIDLAPGDSRQALVIDYKSSKRPESIRRKLARGLELQLPLYLLVLPRLMGLKPLGAELRYLKGDSEEGIYVEEAREILALGPKKRLYSEEEFSQLLTATEDLVRETVGRFRSADISVRSRSCDFCDYDSVCRFEKWRIIYFE